MLVGIVKSMRNAVTGKRTPNSGILTDLGSGTNYAFSRPAFTGRATKWNVKTHDIVTYIPSGTHATEVTLYRRGRKDRVITTLDLVLTDDAGNRLTNETNELIKI